jgi:transglutaminase-like putative cysteine protease
VRLGRRVFVFLAHVDRLILAAMAVVAVVPFTRLFASSLFLAYAAGAAVLALLVAAVSARRSFLTTLLIAVALLVLYLVFAVFHTDVPVVGNLDDLSRVWAGVSKSLGATLSASLPLISSGSLMTLPVILAWGASLIGVALAARTRLIGLTLVPSLAAFVVGLLLTGQRPIGFPTAPLLLLGGALMVVLVRVHTVGDADGVDGAPNTTAESVAVGSTDARPVTPVHLRIGVPLLAAVTAIGIVAGTNLPLVQDDQRFDLRDQYPPEVDPPLDRISPLARVADGINNGDAVLFRTTFVYGGPERPPIDRVRIAALEKYDGAVWGTAAQLSAVGAELPNGPPGAAHTASITEATTFADGYRSSFLPALDRPIAIEGDDLSFDRKSGMVVYGGGAPGPGPGYRYQVTSAVPIFDPDELRNAPSDVDPLVAELTLLPVRVPDPTTGGAPGQAAPIPIPAEIADYADQPQFSLRSPYESLLAVQKDMLSQNFGYNPKATPGHSFGALKNFLGVTAGPDGKPTGHVGFSEQYAAALALIARLKHLPSRVAVGYRVDPKKVAAGEQIDVRAGDIHAWAEVNIKGIGWVAFDGLNRDNIKPPDVTPIAAAPTPAPVSTPGAPPPPDAVASANGGGCDVLANPDCVPTETELILWPLLLLSLLVLVPAGIVIARLVRRRLRRSRGTPTRRIIGAWRETQDRMLTNGLPTSKAMTAVELSESCVALAGQKAAGRLAEMGPVIDVALYGEDDPPERLAAAAWDAEAGVKDALKERIGRMRRLRNLGDPRPLLRR